MATLIAAAALVWPTMSLATVGGSFSIRPGEVDQSNPATRAYFIPKLKPGTSRVETVVVANGGHIPVTLRVYAVDGLTGQTSGAVYANRDQPRRKAGRWVTPGRTLLTLQPETQATVPFTVRVPRGTAPGDHLAGIAFEDANPTVSTGRFRIRQVVREILGVLVQVPGPARPHLRLGHMALETFPGTGLASVLVTISNGGDALCKPLLQVSLTADRSRQTVSRQLDTILPGDTIAYPLVLAHGVNPAGYLVAARISCQSSSARRSVHLLLGARLRGLQDSQPTTSTATAVKSRSRPPIWAFLGIVAAAAVGGIAVGARLRVRRPRG